MAKIYWFTGQPGVGKTVLAKKLVDFLSTEKRNWRSKVFHIDDDNVGSLENTESNVDTNIFVIKNTQMMANFIYNSGCDVVVSTNSPFKDLRDEFKSKIGNDIEEFYIYNSKKQTNPKLNTYNYEVPETNYFSIDTAKQNPIQSFSKIVYYLKEK
jgi:adenylylsulfate kinase-like enzyme